MSAIRLLQAERHEDIQHLHKQLVTGGILQKELLEEAESYLIQKDIYDVTLIEECDFREYKKLLIDSGRYTRQSAVERSSALRKIQRYWVEQEYGELIAEVKECQVSDAPLKGNIQRFLIRQGIHHIKDIDYTVRSRYEAELQKTGNEQRVMKYLKVFDHIKQYSVQSEISSLPGMARNRMQYKAQIIFLPYLPDPKLVKDFEYIQDKQELVWDFARIAPEKLKKQVFLLLNYILENLYRDDPKERRVRFLLPLHWLYDFCVDEDIEDLERLELSQIDQFEKIVEKKVVNVKNSMQIIDNSRKILFLTAPEIHWHANVWYMERFHLSEDRLNPSSPVQPDIREEVKKAVFMHLKYSPLGTIQSEMTAIKRFARFLEKRCPDIKSLQELERLHIEQYLIYLQTEAHERKNYRSDLYALRRVLEDVGNLYERQSLSELFLSNDFPSTPRHLFKFYSDAEIKRLNEHIFKMDEQICRALIIHQLLGTRISDTLTLKPDCLSMREGRYFIRIDQVKSVTYEKAISEEVARLIMKAIDYTKERYGETTYIFVKKNDPTKPYQYSMIQNQIMKMIRQEDIRDDNGELLQFGTHIFRHCYGKKLTEMHVDDWMIARLLGHTSTQSVHYYRKIGNKLMADETRAAREKIDMILLDIIEGWDDYEI